MVVIGGDEVECGELADEPRVPLETSGRRPVEGVTLDLRHLDLPLAVHGCCGARVKGEAEPRSGRVPASHLNVH